MTIHHRHAFLTLCGIVALAVAPEEARAQLNECALIDALGLVDAPGGCIERTLSDADRAGPGRHQHAGVFRISHNARSSARDPPRQAVVSAQVELVRRVGTARDLGLDGRHSRDAPARRRVVGQLRRMSRPAARLSRRRRRRCNVSRQSRCAASIRIGVDRDARRRDDDGPARDSRASAARSANRQCRSGAGPDGWETGSHHRPSRARWSRRA